MKTIADFFRHYKKHNGFPYDPDNDHEREFDKLAYYMNWNKKALKKKEREFYKILDFYHKST